MFKLKKLDKLITYGFVGPYMLSFFVAEFVLIMQFLWKHIDRILGKGISFFQIMELLFFMSVKLIPMAIPLTILISAVMVFGNMSEKYELSSIKSAGVSLLRTMRPGLYIAIGTALFSLLCSNFLVPWANFEFQTRFERIKRTKPTLSFEEGIFSDDFKGYSIRIGSKNKDGRKIEDVIIEDHSNANKSLVNVTIAKSGEMYTTSDGNYFVMNLEDGAQYKDMEANPGKKDNASASAFQFMRTEFKKYTKVFEMSGFSFNENLFELNRNKYDLLNSVQLVRGIDSLNRKIEKKLEGDHIFKSNAGSKSKATLKKEMDFKKRNAKKLKNKGAALKSKSDKILDKRRARQKDSLNLSDLASFVQTIREKDIDKVLKTAKTRISFVKDKAGRTKNSLRTYNSEMRRYVYKLHEAYSWALVCILFLFIGAPLGSIIRKGGYGYPLLFAIIFYMIFMIAVIIGQKLLKSGSMHPILAAWLPCLILIPISAQITRKALKDSKFNFTGWFVSLWNIIKRKET